MLSNYKADSVRSKHRGSLEKKYYAVVWISRSEYKIFRTPFKTRTQALDHAMNLVIRYENLLRNRLNQEEGS